MTNVISAFRTLVRDVTNDTSNVSQHTTDAKIDGFVVDAFRHLYSVRPESRYGSDGMLVDVTFPTDATQLASFSVTYDARWHLGIVYYAASRCYETDTTDSVNRELAALYLQKADGEFLR